MEIKQGRLCNSTAAVDVKAGPAFAPSNGNNNSANVVTNGDEMFGGLEKWVTWPGAGWKDIDAIVKYQG
jgi:hypothetical protein